VLTVRVRFRNTTDKPVRFKLVHSGRYDDNYVSAGETKYKIIRDAKNNVVATPNRWGRLDRAHHQAQGDVRMVAKFPAPPADRKAYTLYLSVGPPIEDVPINDKREDHRVIIRSTEGPSSRTINSVFSSGDTAIEVPAPLGASDARK
jgi:hypothetical protein